MDRAAFLAVVHDWDASVRAVADADGLWELYGVDPVATVLRPPPDPSTIDELEARIGCSVPPSLRWFLERCDGAIADGDGLTWPGGGFLGPADVGWLVDREPTLPHLEPWDISTGWTAAATDAPGELDRLLSLTDHEAHPARDGHLPYCLAISAMLDKTVVLLNPLVRDADGEWECWDFYTHDAPTAYRCFADYLSSRARRLADFARSASSDHVDAATQQDFAALLQQRWRGWRAVRRATRKGEVPIALVGAVREAIERDLSDHTLWPLQALPGSVQLELATHAWRRAAGDTEAQRQIAAAVTGSQHEPVRTWLVDRLTEMLEQQPHTAERLLLGVNGLVLGRLWRRAPSDALFAKLIGTYGMEDLDSIRNEALYRLADDEWVRSADQLTVGRALTLAGGAGEAARPVLCSLVGRHGVPAVQLAQALLRVGAYDDALPLAAQHLPISSVDALPFVPADVKAEHRRRRVEAAPVAATAFHLAAHHDDETTDLILGLRAAIGDDVVVAALERQHTARARDELAVMAATAPPAIRVLARLGDHRATTHLRALIDHPNADVRRFGAEGIRELGDPTLIGSLAISARNATDDDVRAIAAHALVIHTPSQAPPYLTWWAQTDRRADIIATHWIDLLDARATPS